MMRHDASRHDRSGLATAFEPLEGRRLFAQGFITDAPPYVVPSDPHVEVTPILTVGDAVPEADAAHDRVDFQVRVVDGKITQVALKQDGVYRMVGIPDGLGAFENDNGDGNDSGGARGGTFTVVMNHELARAEGTLRDHGATGSFVSRWVLRKRDLKVVSGDDQVKQVYLRNAATGRFEPAAYAFERLCSTTLPKQSAFYDSRTGLGTTEKILLNGEETRPPFTPTHGRAFGHVLTGRENGNSYELNDMGEMSYENLVPNPFPQKKTVVVNSDDSTNAFTSAESATDPAGATTQPSEVYVYVGEKRRSGNVVERAGLTGGSLFGVRVIDKPTEATVANGDRFQLAQMSRPAQDEGSVLQAESVQKQVTEFRRVEDGNWDPTNPRDFYYTTTDRFGGQTRLWRLRFDDVTRPERGGRIDIVVDSPADAPGEMFDNLTIDAQGRVLLQEDPGNNAYLARIWLVNKATGQLTELAQSNPGLFAAPPVKTIDEEHSGIIDVSDILGPGHYLFDTQAHLKLADPELVEDGQFQAMKIDFGDASGPFASPGRNDRDDDDHEGPGWAASLLA